jgi:hypothetical protein
MYLTLQSSPFPYVFVKGFKTLGWGLYTMHKDQPPTFFLWYPVIPWYPASTMENVLNPLIPRGYHRKKKERGGVSYRRAWVQALLWFEICRSEAGRLRERVENHRRAYILRSFSYVKQSWDFFHFLETATGWLVPSAGQKIPVQPAWLVPSTTEDPAWWKQVSWGR